MGCAVRDELHFMVLIGGAEEQAALPHMVEGKM